MRLEANKNVSNNNNHDTEDMQRINHNPLPLHLPAVGMNNPIEDSSKLVVSKKNNNNGIHNDSCVILRNVEEGEKNKFLAEDNNTHKKNIIGVNTNAETSVKNGEEMQEHPNFDNIMMKNNTDAITNTALHSQHHQADSHEENVTTANDNKLVVVAPNAVVHQGLLSTECEMTTEDNTAAGTINNELVISNGNPDDNNLHSTLSVTPSLFKSPSSPVTITNHDVESGLNHRNNNDDNRYDGVVTLTKEKGTKEEDNITSSLTSSRQEDNESIMMIEQQETTTYNGSSLDQRINNMTILSCSSRTSPATSPIISRREEEITATSYSSSRIILPGSGTAQSFAMETENIPLTTITVVPSNMNNEVSQLNDTDTDIHLGERIILVDEEQASLPPSPPMEELLGSPEIPLSPTPSTEQGLYLEHRHDTTTLHHHRRRRHKNKEVRFAVVEIREYTITIGDNPWCSCGTPLSLDWDYTALNPVCIDAFEKTKTRRSARQMLLNYYQRRDLLWRCGHELEEIEMGGKEVDRERRRRFLTSYFEPLVRLEEIFTLCIAFGCRRPKSFAVQQAEVFDRVIEEHSSVGSDTMSERSAQHYIKQKYAESQQGGSMSGHDADDDDDDDEDYMYTASEDSRFDRYAVKVDHSQHDKSTQILLFNCARPHMRAFHLAWISFFTAFFTWFAITPLLGEVLKSLQLTKSDIWISNMCGTVGTIFMRIIMGPACDKFGARICMAFILIASAIPTALTGLVSTANGLYAVRIFIGIAGSSFVACQYWTSSMFTREVAGTANALVAGWGNLGGGVTQVVVGSVLFPLLRLIYSTSSDAEGADEQIIATNMAWRTAFIFPALISFIVAYICVVYCDDSPKGGYQDLVRQEKILIVNPCTSLWGAARKRNTWILFIQYACCFGVEVTMTNGTALYFGERFGLETVSAAGIASIFGFMNLFARGLGGAASDICNMKFGIYGRIMWQCICLVLEGGAIIWFALSDTLVGAIFVLILTSIAVQSAEGSTFGIVPYVDRRFTGSVVGWVGAGGSVGGAIFAFFFTIYSDRKAFIVMGFTSALSGLLSFLVDTKSLVQIHYQIHHGGDHQQQLQQQHSNTENNSNNGNHQHHPAATRGQQLSEF